MLRDYHEHMPLVLTATEMADMDRKAIDELGIPGMVLMENAGREVVAQIKALLGNPKNKKVVIFCGKGNNGGDGYVVARYLVNMGARVEIYLIGEHNEVQGDARTNLEILTRLGVNALPIKAWLKQSPAPGFDLVVDALLGTGVKGELKGNYRNIVESINTLRAPKVAIDLPTGMETDTGAVHGPCVHADVTVTMACLKRGLLLSPGREHAGRVVVADIGMPQVVLNESGIRTFQSTEKFIQNVLPRRAPNAFKNRCGTVFVIGGSAGMTGAVTLSSEAALRVGAGMAMLGIPGSLNPILETKLTEVMTLPLQETESQSISYEAREKISERLSWSNVLAVGPGLTTHEDSLKLLEWLLQNYEHPIVLDADALNCLAKKMDIIKNAKSDLILTPHPGELSRLTGKTTKDILADPIEVARETAQKWGFVLILKGGPTIIASPDGDVFINPTGNAGMATAGMGDVLTGVVAGLIAQGMSVVDGAVAAVYLHGLAGDFVKAEMGQAGLIAGDVAGHLPSVMKYFEDKF